MNVDDLAEREATERERHFMNGDYLDEKLEVARAHPQIAHFILRGPSPTCSLCGGTNAPIVDGKHLNPERWCK